MNKVFKYINVIIIVLFSLIILCIVSLYIHPIQVFVKNNVIDYVNKKSKINILLDDFKLRFPLDIKANNVKIITAQKDTLVSVDSLLLDMGLMRAFLGEIKINQLKAINSRVNIKNDSTGLLLNIKSQNLKLSTHSVDFKKKFLFVNRIFIEDAWVELKSGNNSHKDTIKSNSTFGWKFKVEKSTLKNVGYKMYSKSLPYLGSKVLSGKLKNSMVDIENRLVLSDSVMLDGAACRIDLAENTEEKVKIKQTKIDYDDGWQVKAGNVKMYNSDFSMKMPNYKNRFKMQFSGIKVSLDSVYNLGRIVKCRLKDFSVVQDSGLIIDRAYGNVILDSNRTNVAGFRIKTDKTDLVLSANLAAPIVNIMDNYPLDVRIKGNIGISDLGIVVDSIPPEIMNDIIKIETAFRFNGVGAKIDSLKLNLPNRMKIDLGGNINNFKDITKLDGNIKGALYAQNVDFINKMLPSFTYKLPHNVGLNYNIKAKKGDLYPILKVYKDDNYVAYIRSYYSNRLKSYNANLIFSKFPVNDFMANDSLGIVSGNVNISGKNYKWGNIIAETKVNIDEVEYKKYIYKNINVDFDVQNSLIRSKLEVKDENLALNLNIDGDSVNGKYKIEIGGNLDKFNLYKTNFSQNKMSIATLLNIKGDFSENNYDAKVLLDSLKYHYLGKNKSLGNIDLYVKSQQDKSNVKLNTGDLDFAFNSDNSILNAITKIYNGVTYAIKDTKTGNFDMSKINRTFPNFDFSVYGKTKNAIVRYLKVHKVSIGKIDLKASSSIDNGFHLDLSVDNPLVRTSYLDNVKLNLTQKKKTLNYKIAISDSDDKFKMSMNANIQGFIRNNLARLTVKQQNSNGDIGIDFGTDIALQDSSFSLRFFPENPIIGYNEWKINRDNWVLFGRNLNLSANLFLRYKDREISLISSKSLYAKNNTVDIKFKNIDIKSTVLNISILPDISGLLNLDLKVYPDKDNIFVDGILDVKKLLYRNDFIGDLNVIANYSIDRATYSKNRFKTNLSLNSYNNLFLDGSVDINNQTYFNIHSKLTQFPLKLINIFIPNNTIILDGGLTGNIDISGNSNKPDFRGLLNFENGRVNVPMLSANFDIDNRVLKITDGRFRVNQFRLMAPDKSILNVDGFIDLYPFNKIKMGLDMSANSLQIVDIRSDKNSLLSGNAKIDFSAKLKGFLSDLNLNGKLKLLNDTEINYSIKDSNTKIKDKTEGVVNFVQFGKDTSWDKDMFRDEVSNTSFRMNMFMDIDKGVKMNINLSEDGANKISIEGGGTLTYSIDENGVNNISGKYTLTNGNVIYGIPLVGDKNFNIVDGSYIEWTGKILSPNVNISASEEINANVITGSVSRLIPFNAIVRIGNTLNKPSVIFDLEAPNDQDVQTQLSVLNKDERSRQAINLMLYGLYSGPGQIDSRITANSAVYGLLEGEINQWARKYLDGANISFGIDTYDQYSTKGKYLRTDFSYKFSKNIFKEKVMVKVGGRISTNNDPEEGIDQTLFDDISLEYMYDSNRNFFIRLFRNSNYDILEGRIYQTGGGLVYRKSFDDIRNIFFRNKKKRTLYETNK